jgi:MFS family permease
MVGALIGAAFLVAQYFQLALSDSPLDTGVRILPWTSTPMLIAPFAGRLSDRIGPRPLMLCGLLLQGVGLTWIALEASATESYGGLILPLLVAGIGISMVFPAAPAAAIGAASAADIGKASGANSNAEVRRRNIAVAMAKPSPRGKTIRACRRKRCRCHLI